MKITFVNHASVLMEHEGTSLLTDPWWFGDAFNAGWQLLAQTPLPPEALSTVDYIWVSHEHPDHFSPRVLTSIPEQERSGVEVLYQETRDGKVLSFCKAKGFATRELGQATPTALRGGLIATCAGVPIYDSWLLLEIGGVRVLNLNDAPLHSPRKLEQFLRDHGPIDVLLTQFGYAGWRGNEEDHALRRSDAERKLAMMERQIRHLRPKVTIPFASFAFYGHEENSYMNDGLGDVAEATRVIERGGSEAVVMFPGDTWSPDAVHDNRPALDRWAELRSALADRPLKSSPKHSWDELCEAADRYAQRITEANDARTLKLLRLNPILPALRPVELHLWDLDCDVRFSFERGLERIDRRTQDYDLRMGSDSLHFMFAHPWGTDTLTVNARFRADAGGVKRLLTTFGVDQLNNVGIRVSPSFLVDFPSHAFLLKALGRKLWSLRAQRTASR
ncbi:MAG: MBL fold metallo-hydrolase [Nannocystales bacterium]